MEMLLSYFVLGHFSYWSGSTLVRQTVEVEVAG